MRARRAPTVMLASATAIVLASGCGDKHPPPAGDNSFTPTNAASGSGDGGFSGDGTKPPGCGQKDDGSFCDCVDASLLTDPPNLYFVLDRSGSMQEDDKWDSVRIVVARVFREIGPRASFALTLFPTPNAAECDPGLEVLPLRPGDPPSTQDGPTTKAFLAATLQQPFGGTPTAAALTGVKQRVVNLPGKTFVILATDGGPNCDTSTTCDAAGCQPNIEGAPGCDATTNCCAPPSGNPGNCLDSQPTINAVTALKSAGFPVYVIGIPGSAPYASLLDQLAEAGGTAQPTSPKYFRADSASQDQLLATIRKVAAKIVATCEFKLKEPPQDPNAVNVYLDETVDPKDPVNGWKLDGDTVTLLGASCDKVQNGDVLDVRIIVGCPTVQPH